MKKQFLFPLFIIIYMSCSTVHPGILFSVTGQHIEHRSAGSQLSSAKVLKSGESCSMSSWLFDIFLLYYGSGGSIAEAKLNGKINKIAVIDRKSLQILGPVFYRECVIVWGE
ncbi:MAG: TRL-like family protein [Leptospira sp.]|nr:TRL-like family protein [Leptospira sp.]